jgi:penicillin-binding protein 1C
VQASATRLHLRRSLLLYYPRLNILPLLYKPGYKVPSLPAFFSRYLPPSFRRLFRQPLFYPGLLLSGILLALNFAPLPAALGQTDYATMLLARDGRLLGARIATDEQWRFAPIEQVPEKYRLALVLFEDGRFYRHPGIDPLALARATLGNFRSGRITSGGSTITMQLARLLRQADARLGGATDNPPRSLFSKMVEALRALQLEWHFTKDELLVHYTSHAPFGGNIVGVRAAAWRYFERAPEDLSWAEAALLAVLPNSPTLIHPGRQRDRLLQKRNRLLKRLHERGQMSDLDLQLALLEPLPERPQSLPQAAPHLLDSLSQGYPGNAVFHSTLEPRLQQAANTIAERHGRRLASEGIHNLALVVIDHQRMETVAYIGNQAWQNQAQFSPRVDILQRPRSSGSILKPLLYGLMLQAGELLPTQLVADIPTRYGGYGPQNYDRQFRGAVPAHEALAHSLNVPAVRMLHQYGVSRFQHQLQSLGMTTLFRPADDYGLTLILGGAEGTLWELTAIFARLTATARDGDNHAQPDQPRLLVTESTSAGRLPVLRQGAAWLTLQAMIEVARPGADSLWRDFSGSQTIAWKTGTSYGLRDAWAIGSNSRYTVGVWAGNAGGEPAPGLTGHTSAAPVMFDLFDRLGASGWFARPDHALKWVSVCRDDGYLAGGQCAATDIQIPRESHFQQVTPHHRRIHLDGGQQFRVHSRCENVSAMQAVDWFVLPPAQEFFWKQRHSGYRLLPPWRNDCLAEMSDVDDDQPMDLLYPHEGSRLYIPVGLDGKRSRALLQAVHRRPGMTLFWHLDDEFLGQTNLFHEQSVSLEPGWHKLKLLDQQGYQLERWFRVLGEAE